MTYVPFQDAKGVGDRFLTLLSKLRIHPPSGSGLEDELLSLTQLIEVMKNPNLAVGADAVELLRSAAGLHDLAAKVLSIEPLPEFAKFVPHLRLISEAKGLAGSLGQNAAGGIFNDTSRKIAELYFGCLAAHAGSNVQLDSPTNAKGDNPDVVFTAQQAGAAEPQKWALAIKTISSRQGQTIFERIKDGARQINNCPADKGLIVINAKDALDHGALWNTDFKTLSDATNRLCSELDQLAANADLQRPQAEWDNLFVNKAVRPVLFLGQSLVRLQATAGLQTPTSLKVIMPYDANGVLDPAGHGLAGLLNHFMQTILIGIPGSPGRSPM